mmetsp:Transcript_19063/g.42893  ORF Transcript_19063/g.42893 Transcript_19063/m.42893 type:complete len:237 (+) Transcript_19063:2053-2763(+)
MPLRTKPGRKSRTWPRMRWRRAPSGGCKTSARYPRCYKPRRQSWTPSLPRPSRAGGVWSRHPGISSPRPPEASWRHPPGAFSRRPGISSRPITCPHPRGSRRPQISRLLPESSWRRQRPSKRARGVSFSAPSPRPRGAGRCRHARRTLRSPRRSPSLAAPMRWNPTWCRTGGACSPRPRSCPRSRPSSTAPSRRRFRSRPSSSARPRAITTGSARRKTCTQSWPRSQSWAGRWWMP